MSYEEILKVLKNNDSVTVDVGDDDLCFSRRVNNLWGRKIWGVWAYLTDEELAEELIEDYTVEFIY